MEKSQDLKKEISSTDDVEVEKEIGYIQKIDRQVALFNESVGTGNCELCKGKGIIFVREGNYPAIKSCRCKIQKEANELLIKNGFGRMANYTLDSYVVEYEWQSNVKKSAFDFINQDVPRGFLITGQPGSGKTHLLACIANELFSKRAIIPLYISFTSWVSSLKDSLASGKTIGDEIKKLQSAPILLLDDVLKSSTLGRITPFDLETLFQIIDFRYKANSLITLMSSELLPDTLYRVDNALAGRMFEMSGSFNIQIKENKNYDFRLPEEN